MAGHVHNSIGLMPALNPYLGYAPLPPEIAKDAMLTNRSVADIALERASSPRSSASAIWLPNDGQPGPGGPDA